MTSIPPAQRGTTVDPFTASERYYWRIALELKLRKSNSDAFQDFFSTVMGLLHGDDFVRVRPYGSLGDKGCDGYLQSDGQLFQCYGALAGELKQVGTLTTKMTDDFAKALKNLAAIMREWHMVHNIADGLPVEALTTMSALKEANPSLAFGFVGMEGFSERVFRLQPFQIESLLGPAASDMDAASLDTATLRDLVQHLRNEADAIDFNAQDLRPVPLHKLTYNNLPNHWKQLIAGGWKNAHLVGQYFDRHPDPLTGERIAKLFRDRYEYLKAQLLNPGDIMASLYELVTGIGTVPPQKQVAVQSLLAFLFENCDIFEREPIAPVTP
ncbi:ABC-three component system protein [Xanthomonas pisi]|uniref:ABC-three component systems C-terminal domain-containing protein n=1 Tax=Xanthomonas pisi TaxID=56457 RepID=A0A2S7D0U1_9XANT|nr:ABC-three component system protein [Xanthomonas pisi]PPU67339.1 hypothetical protein XpiCFBP4643_15805 [Xanthomonas pisi]